MDVYGGSILRETTPKSSDKFAEESQKQVERHGIARYSITDTCQLQSAVERLNWGGTAKQTLRPHDGRSVFVLTMSLRAPKGWSNLK